MCVGVYIHIPFCKSRCSYCDFATDVYRDQQSIERYVSALVCEIRNAPNATKLRAETLYFGGGTPSLLSAKQLDLILLALHEQFEFTEKFEFTLEMNPATVTLEKLKDFRQLGVNRASFGVQTFDDRALKMLARGHDSQDVYHTFELLRRANFTNISLDLIGGLPRQSLADWEDNLNKALYLQPEHLSLYLLEIHQNTPLAEQIRSKRQPLPDEDLAAEMYELMCEKTQIAELNQYEISNFAKRGFESQHNSKYWLCKPVLGFGVSAHSFDGNRRFSNEQNTQKYISLVKNESFATVETNALSENQLASEFAFLNLRLSAGLNLLDYQKRFGVDLVAKFDEKLSQLRDAGLVEIIEGSLRLTQKGKVYSNEVFAIFV